MPGYARVLRPRSVRCGVKSSPPESQHQTSAGQAGTAAHPLLVVRDLKTHFPRRSGVLHRVREVVKAVDGVSFSLSPGETLGLVGESGCGKTTVGRTILRLIPATSGSVVFNSTDVLAARGETLRRLRRDMQIVFQDPAGSLNPRMRIAEIVSEPLVVHQISRGRDELRAKAKELLERCGMQASALDRYPHQFSGGQRQRIGIARALALNPRFIVCDEPTSALDVSVQAQILNLLSDLRRDLGLAYLFISHDLGVVRHLCTRVAVMRRGVIVEEGDRDQITTNPTHEYTKQLLSAIPIATPRRGG
jgi:oligopeptide transport system ATP-binding protein